MNILVTGGAGFIGSNFVFLELKEHPEDRIICVDKLTYAGNLKTLKDVMDNPQFVFYKTDICDREAIDEIFAKERPDIVVNFAAESHVDRSIENPEVFLETNIIGTSVLMDASRKYGVKRYHQVSTDEVYGDLPLDTILADLYYVAPLVAIAEAHSPCPLLTELAHILPYLSSLVIQLHVLLRSLERTLAVRDGVQFPVARFLSYQLVACIHRCRFMLHKNPHPLSGCWSIFTQRKRGRAPCAHPLSG